MRTDLESAVAKHSSLDINPSGISPFNGKDLVLLIDMSDDLQMLHLGVIDAVRAHRTDYHHKRYDDQEYRDSNFKDLHCYGNLKLYGMPFASDLYNPHVTLAYDLEPDVLSHALGLARDIGLASWRANSVVLSFRDERTKETGIYSMMIFPRKAKLLSEK